MISQQKNQVFITIDSLRWDTFVAAGDLFIKKFPYVKAQTHGTYTFPSHMAFFVGKLPCTSRGVFDTCAKSGRRTEGTAIWRMKSPESHAPADFLLDGRNVVDGFRRKGYISIGTGGVSWFDSSQPLNIPQFIEFDEWKWFGKYTHGPEQTDWLIEFLDAKRADERAFIFVNYGETHSPFATADHPKKTSWGEGFPALSRAQIRCLQFVDRLIERLLSHPALFPADFIICGDHGDCFGEDGLYGHSFAHPAVLTVPMIRGEARR
jgi:hypothetical protein